MLSSLTFRVAPAKVLLIVLTIRGVLDTDAGAYEQQPDILLVLFDDLGYGQPRSFAENSPFQMPAVDALAASGMRFADAHSASAVCTPTRYGLLTGRSPARIGQFGVCTTYSPPLIPPERLTVASLLKTAGYETACIGKWHLGLLWEGKPGTQSRLPPGEEFRGGPNELGFDYFFGFTHARNISSLLEQNRVVDHVEPEENQPRMLAAAERWLREQSDSEDPFFLYFPMCPPHKPIVPSADFRGRVGAVDRIGNDPLYGDWILQGDEMLGRLLQVIEDSGRSRETLVIVASDNGAEGRAYPPLRESKRSIYEGGHRVPLIVRWPGHVPPGTTCDAPVCLNDLLATLAEIVGIPLPDNAGEDSVSLLPLLQDPNGRLVRQGILHQSSRGDLAVRRENWKLVLHRDGRRELFRLDTDLSETDDLSIGEPDRVRSLTATLESWIQNGRSTAGARQENEVRMRLPGRAP